MARLPSGYHWVSGRDKKQGATGPRGEHLTRQQAENRGAEELGLKNEYEGRKLRKILDREPSELRGQAKANSTNYRRDLRDARSTARRRGVRFDRSRFDASIIVMKAERGGTETFNRALDQFRFLTGKSESANPYGR